MVKTANHPRLKRPAQNAIRVSRSRGRKILDVQARKYLGMSGEEFARKYQAGEIEEPDRADVLRVAMLIPLAEK